MITYRPLNMALMLAVLPIPGIAEAQLTAEVHPVILYTADEVDAIRSRFDRDPYAGWLSSIQERADDALALDIEWSGSDPQKDDQAYYAKIMAAAYVFTDPADPRRESWADEAAEALYGIPSGNYNKENRFDSDLEVSKAAAAWAAAYDMLAGAGYDFVVNGDNLHADIRLKLDLLRRYMAADYFDLSTPSIGRDWFSCAWTSRTRADNHHVKRYAVLAMVSIAIYNRGGADDALNRARSRLLEALDNMIVNGGDGESVWAEGPNYHLYSMKEYIPAFIAMKNAGYYDYTGLADLAQAHLSLPRMAMPDAELPPFDDNEAVVPFMAGLLSSMYPGLPGRETLNWLWESAGRPIDLMFLPDYLARYDDGIPLADPGASGWDAFGVYPESGFARFRSSWDSDAVYVLLQAEHGEARIAGQAHEHPDPGSFMLHAYGDLLITDSGYGGFDLHDQTRQAVNHNIILVNGEGPTAASRSGSGYWNANGVDAFLTDTFSTAGLDYAVSETEYRNASFSRHVFFPGRRYALLYDRIESDADNTYTMLLHGYGGGDTGGTFAMENDGGRWERDNAGVRSFTTGTGSLTFTAQDYPHAVYRRSPLGSHTALEIDQAGRDAGYLTLLYPYPHGESMPAIAAIDGDNATGFGIAWGDSADYTALADGDAPLEFAAGDHTVTTDAEMVWLRERGGSFDDFTLLNGASLMDGEDMLLTASGKTTISLSYLGEEAVEGYVSAALDTRITIPVPDSVEVTINGRHTYHETKGGATTFWVIENGYWRMERSGVIVLDPPEDFRAADVPDDNGHQMDLFWSPSPSEAGGYVSHYRIYRSRSPEFGEVRPQDSFTGYEEIVAWEEANVTLVDSVAAGETTYRDTQVPLNGVYYYFIEAVGDDGVSGKVSANEIATGVADSIPERPMLSTSPNPFNASVTISYTLPASADIRLRIFTITGQETAVLDAGVRDAGNHAVVWNADGMPSGAYICLLEADGLRMRRKMLLLK